MYYEPLTEKHSLPWDPFKSCTVPRAIGWISTKNEDGTDNIAPYSHFTNLTFDPPTVLISATQNIFGERKTTVRNIERTGEFILNMVSYDLREEMNRSSIVEVPEGFTDKFDYAGLTKAKANSVDVARVAESPVHYECKFVQTIRFPKENVLATVDLIIGQVVGIHIADEKITEEGKVDIPNIKPLARLGYRDYTYVTETFEMKSPPISPELQAEADKKLKGRK